MQYADRRCKVIATDAGYLVTGKDLFTGKEVKVTIPCHELWAYRQGAMIQHAMPSLSVQEREFLISGIYEDEGIFDGDD